MSTSKEFKVLPFSTKQLRTQTVDKKPPQNPEERKIVSLQDRRKKKQQETHRKRKPYESRILDLEQDMLRVVESLMDMQKQLESQRDTLFKLLRLLNKK